MGKSVWPLYTYKGELYCMPAGKPKMTAVNLKKMQNKLYAFLLGTSSMTFPVTGLSDDDEVKKYPMLFLPIANDLSI